MLNKRSFKQKELFTWMGVAAFLAAWTQVKYGWLQRLGVSV